MRRIASIALLLALTLALTACPDDKPDPGAPPLTEAQKAEKQKKDAERVVTAVALGIDTAAQGIESGVPTVKAFRLSGKIKPATSLSLAKKAKKLNAIMEKVADFLLSHSELTDADRRSVADDIDELLTLAQDIGSVTVSENGNTQLAFNLGVLAAKTGLQISARNFGKSLPPGFAIPVNERARESLRRAKDTMRGNAVLLDKSIEELSR
jgi:hypothetical protein